MQLIILSEVVQLRGGALAFGISLREITGNEAE